MGTAAGGHPRVYVERLSAATACLVKDIDGLGEDDVRGPSLLPGWTRGHVLTHLARNAEGGTRLLGWARTGIPGYEYESVTVRAAAIEDGAGRPAAQLIDDVRVTAAAFAAAALALPEDNWHSLVTWTTGQQTPADMIVRSRLTEVLVHHVDLAIGFGPGSWPAAFTGEMLVAVAASLTARGLAPVPAVLRAAGTGRVVRLGGDAADTITVSGTEADLLAWLLGRSHGECLDRDTPGPLPSMPSVYLT
jgi:maleylpyruvate isomerase